MITNEIFESYREDQVKQKEAKGFLESQGYFVGNLWHVDDVMNDYKCSSEDAQDILYSALTNNATMERIWFAIQYHAENEYNLKRKSDDSEKN
jgi:hypothetical protein